MSLLSQIRSRSPPLEHFEKNGKIQNGVDLGSIEKLISAETVEEKNTIWQKLKESSDMTTLIHSPATMKFLNSCVRESSDDSWPENIIIDLLSLGCAGPHVVGMLDVANQRAAHDIVTAAKDPCFPERVLVWSIAAEIERAAKSESNDADSFNELDFLLNRDFCHTYLVGALKSLDTTKAVALLDFLTAKIRLCPIKAGDKKAGIDQISRWVGAVIDAHPSTYSDEENAKMLMEALAVVQEKIDLLEELEKIDKICNHRNAKGTKRKRKKGRYSVSVLKF